MKPARSAALLLTAWALLVGGCAAPGTAPSVRVPVSARTVADHIVYQPTTWSGELRINRPVIVTATASLTVQPGTKVYFDLPEPPPDRDPKPWILVIGTLVAAGTPERPVVFSSVSLRNNELEDMIQVQKAKEVHLRHCVFERGPWALHAHETPTDVVSCVFRHNFGGVRFQGGPVTLRGNRFEDNRIGVRALRTSPIIEENTFSGNLTGIFFRQGVADAVIRRNNFDDREYDIKLGEAQSQDVQAGGNWWKAWEAGRLSDRIYDGADSEGVGAVRVDSPLDAPWGAEAQ
ncbi:MAG: hypothetical protein Kow0092_39970 [Deferrisomatales bacterium]